MAKLFRRIRSGFRVVACDAFGNSSWSDVERSSDRGGTSHIGDDWFASKEASNRERLTTTNKAGFGAFAIKFGEVDTHIGIG